MSGARSQKATWLLSSCLHTLLGHSLSEPSYQDMQSWVMTNTQAGAPAEPGFELGLDTGVKKLQPPESFLVS